MRAVVVIGLSLWLVGCRHMYGSMDAGRLAPATAPLGSR
jgi:hypothetical protein